MNVQNAAETLAQDLITKGGVGTQSNSTATTTTTNIITTTYPNPKLYMTTISLIVFIYLMFIIQLKRSRKDIAVSYKDIIRRKQFHKLFIAIFSHPTPDECLSSISSSSSNSNMESEESHHNNHSSRQRRRIRFDIDYGNNYEHNSRSSSHFMSIEYYYDRIQMVGSQIYKLIRDYVFYPLVLGKLAGLPLVTYVVHVLWQCRALEEVYDYTYDSNIPLLYNQDFNITTIIDRDMIIQNALREKHFIKKNLGGKMVYNLSYYRVLFALLFSSYIMEFIGTFLSLRYLHNIRQVSEETESISTTSSSQHHNRILDTLENRSICTLTPMITALLVVYMGHFPYSPISVLPFIDTSFIFGKSSQATFFACSFILTILSYRVYPLTGVFYGSISGLLWTSDFIKFLADVYWGGWWIVIFLFSCAASLKASQVHDERIFHGNKITRDLLFWLDYVGWDNYDDSSLTSML